MIFYHATSRKYWKRIQKTGILFGRENWNLRRVMPHCCRATWLALTPEVASNFGKIILEVRYTPNPGIWDNYIPGCWQVCVYVPLFLFRRIK